MHILAVNIFTGDIPLHSPECPLAYMNLFKHPIPPRPPPKKKSEKKGKNIHGLEKFPAWAMFPGHSILKISLNFEILRSNYSSLARFQAFNYMHISHISSNNNCDQLFPI